MRSLLTGHGYFNADYDYVGAALDGYMPFDFATFAANPARLAIQGFEADTGKTVVWDKAVMGATIPMMEHIRASSTLPGIMKPIKVDGHVMYDGGLGEGAGLPTHMAEDAGFGRLVVVCTRPAGYRKTAPTGRDLRIYHAVSRGNEAVEAALATRWERYNDAMGHLDSLEREGRAWVFRPDVMPVRSTTIDRPKLEESYAMGYEQAERDFPRMMEWLHG